MQKRRRLFPGGVLPEAYRLVNGSADGLPGLVVEIFGRIGVAHVYETSWLLPAREWGRALCGTAGLEALVLKNRVRGEARGEEGERAEGEEDAGPKGSAAENGPGSRPLVGDCPPALVLAEGLLRFEVRFFQTLNVGLFLDTRPLRRLLLAEAAGLEVLNLFSYTCSLGLAAAKGGANRVVNVDVSSAYLERGAASLALNGLGSEAMAFLRMDSEAHLDYGLRKGIAYDLIVLDPPSFGRHKGGAYSFRRDYGRLLRKCFALCRKGGRVFALTNHAKTSRREFESLVLETAASLGLRPGLRFLPLDPDCAGPDSRERIGMRGDGWLLLLECRVPDLPSGASRP